VHTDSAPAPGTSTGTPRHPGERVISDGNNVISEVAYKANGGLVIYTITPSSPFGEEAAKRAARGVRNIYGVVPKVFMACDEAAAASFVQGLAAKGVGSATCSSSQGILLMIPEMYNSAGQLLPISFYIGARDLSRHSLTIFAGHSDVYAVRDTGILILFSRDAQELQDLGIIAERLKWEVSLPVAVVYDGFLTTHKQTWLQAAPDELYWDFMPHEKMIAHKSRSLDPAHPAVWGTNENPDGYMQAGLAQRPHATAVEEVLPRLMKEFSELTGRTYTPYEYDGHPAATDIIVAAGSSISTLRATVRYLLEQDPDRRIGVLNARTFRPFLVKDFIATLPGTVERIAVLDRSLNHTLQDEPLCADVRSAVMKAVQGFAGVPRLDRLPVVTGGIYGLAGKDFHPGSVLEVFEHLQSLARGGNPWTNFSVGVVDDVNHTSLELGPSPDIFAGREMRQARIVAYGSDGTVSMVKTAAYTYAALRHGDGGECGLYIGSHAEYDSKKAGGVTVSHFRVATEAFEECFDVRTPDYVAVHHPALLTKRAGILEGVRQGGTFVVNTPLPPDAVYASLPEDLQQVILERELEVYCIDAFGIAHEEGLGNKISMIMQRVLFDRFGLIAAEEADSAMEAGITKAFTKKGPEVIAQNNRAFRRAVEALARVPVPATTNGKGEVATIDSADLITDQRQAPSSDLDRLEVPHPAEQGFRERIQGLGMSGLGNEVPVSAYFDHARGGSRPVNTWKGLERSFATQLPTFEPWACNECGECVFICPTGGALEQAILSPEQEQGLVGDPLAMVFRGAGGASLDPTGNGGLLRPQNLRPNDSYGVAVDPNLCTGCGLCAEVCDKGAIKLRSVTPEYVQSLSSRRQVLDKARDAGADTDPTLDLSLRRHTMPEMESLPNYLGASGACAGCYEPLYVSKFLQLHPYSVISNATGCSSIWGAQAYETPFGTDHHGYGPAWVNPLFENNAAVGGGIALGMEQEREQMDVSGAYVLKAMSSQPEIAATPAFRALSGVIGEMQEMASSEGKTLQDRFERVELVVRVQQAIEGALQATPAGDIPLRTHLGLLKSTITTFADKKTLIVGGDGWAFDIGLQMMLHVLQSDLDVVVMVLVTDVYSNTGGQMSKATPKGMDAPFAPGGKDQQRFPLGISVAYAHNAYVGQVNLAYPNHLIEAYKRAADFQGPSLLLCYVPCMTAQKFDARAVAEQARRATTTRYWPLWTYDPETDVWSITGNPESRRGEAKFEGDFIDWFARLEGRFRSQFNGAGEPSGLLLSQKEENLRIWKLLQDNAAASQA